ncbi:tagaturonate reductase [Winogradskyella sp.]|uniref:tagaturonate reductase n=1 Tax=Winogradskyella sp. TaxID=1883156 RepID=UPI00261B2902|nr:tagaturonate reductase [Winogradskyella sp.]
MSKHKLPVKIIQFGKGNFLRGFSTWMIEILNEETDFNGCIEIVETFDTIKSQQLIDQDFKYHVIERGIENNSIIDRITKINAVTGLTNAVKEYNKFLKLALDPQLKFIISNTTEAGIIFKNEDTDISTPQTFPSRLTALLFHRFQHLGHLEEHIFVLTCELIDKNADTLKSFVLKYCELWKLSLEFIEWIGKSIVFCNTLVDRIVSGYPRIPETFHKRIDFQDELLVECEPFHFWAIEKKGGINKVLPVHKTKLNVQFVENIKPYKDIKVRILNGAHTAMVALGMVNGIKTVDEFMHHKLLSAFLENMLNDEILPTLSRNHNDSNDFKDKVYDRFKNPFLKHQLSAIQLNSISKFRSRLLPTLKDYLSIKGSLPHYITEVLAHLFLLYRDSHSPSGFELKDDPRVLDIFRKAWSQNNLETTLSILLGNKILWGENLCLIKDLKDEIAAILERLNTAKEM